MSLTPLQVALAAFEIVLLLTGAWLIARIFGMPGLRARTFERSRIPHWELNGAEAGLLVMTILLLGIVGQSVAMHFFGDAIRSSGQRSGLEVVAYGIGFHGIALFGWLVFRLLRRALHADYGVAPAPVPTAYRQSPDKIVIHALSAVVIAMPVLALTSASWNLVLRSVGLPDEPQDLIAVFGGVQSPALMAVMVFVAVVLAPINEELLFRGAIFRSCRQRFGRAPALVLSGVLFGALHFNWASFLPLVVLGMIFALAYERTGDIRVPIIAHGLFNLNTLIVVLSGLPTT